MSPPVLPARGPVPGGWHGQGWLRPRRAHPAGVELLRGLSETVAPRTREVFSGIAAKDLATAHRVLRQVIDRIRDREHSE
jgi:hypothetical protein